MKYRKILSLLTLILCLVVLMELTGCATSSNRKTVDSPDKLSDATAQAAEEEDEKDRDEGRTKTKDDTNSKKSSSRDYENYFPEDWNIGTRFLVGLFLSIFIGGGDDDKEENNNDNGEQSGDEGGFGVRRNHMNAWYSLSRFGGDAIKNFSTVTLMYSVYRGYQYRANIGIYYGRGNLGSQHNLEESLQSLEEWGIDFGARGYLTPSRSMMGVYVLTGIRLGGMGWSYTEPINVPEGSGGSEDLSTDAVGLFVPYIGIGVSLVQKKSVHLGVNLTLGGRYMSGTTREEIENVVFQDVAEYKLNFEASFFF
jgi:hypothetical protein